MGKLPVCSVLCCPWQTCGARNYGGNRRATFLLKPCISLLNSNSKYFRRKLSEEFWIWSCNNNMQVGPGKRLYTKWFGYRWKTWCMLWNCFMLRWNKLHSNFAPKMQMNRSMIWIKDCHNIVSTLYKPVLPTFNWLHLNTTERLVLPKDWKKYSTLISLDAHFGLFLLCR